MSAAAQDAPFTSAAVLADAVSVAQLQEVLGGELLGDGGTTVVRLAPLARAGHDSITFLAQARLMAQLEGCQAACVILPVALREQALRLPSALLVADPYLAFARLTQWWAQHTRPAAPVGVHPSAVVAPDAVLGAGVRVAALAVVEAGAMLGDGVEVGTHCHVGAGVRIGARTRLAPHVTLMHGTRVGDDCLIHSGAVIGADGFGFAPSGGEWVKIEQLGGVCIGDRVEIGANTCIDRGALDDTVIGHGVKLDNLIQIAHNVQIGDGSAMAGCAGVAGSTRIGRGCTIGGAANIVGHISIADGTHVSAATTITASIHKPGHYTGVFPMDDHAAWEKNAAILRGLRTLRERVRNLEKKSSA